jgi:hypothetical protein
MKLDVAALSKVTTAFKPKFFARIFPMAFQGSPLGTAPSDARFSSLNGNFNTLYAASTLATAIAETIIRDRFEAAERLLMASELKDRAVVELSATLALDLVDLRTDGCFQLGVSTDITGAKGWEPSRVLAQYVHDETPLDGFLYRSRLVGMDCVAVFDRAIEPKLVAGKAMPLIAAPHLVAAINQLSVEVIV